MIHHWSKRSHGATNCTARFYVNTPSDDLTFKIGLTCDDKGVNNPYLVDFNRAFYHHVTGLGFGAFNQTRLTDFQSVVNIYLSTDHTVNTEIPTGTNITMDLISNGYTRDLQLGWLGGTMLLPEPRHQFSDALHKQA